MIKKWKNGEKNNGQKLKKNKRGGEMALKTILLRSKIDGKKAELEALRAKDADFATREEELLQSIDEAKTAEDRTAVEKAVDEFEQDKEAHETAKTNLNGEIEELERSLEEAERSVKSTRKQEEHKQTKTEMRGVNKMEIRKLPMNVRAFDALTAEQKRSIVAQDDVQTFFAELRNAAKNQRSISGGELTIPVVLLDLISENIFRYSKLMDKVRVRNVAGQARQTIAGTIPEAVWQEMCGAINELNFVFNQVTLDGFKVAGYIPVCNSLLEDNDINLAGWLVEALAEAIGLAKDKAIIYGKGAANKMPMGIVTRLAQQSEPADYPANAPAWKDLHTSNIIKIDSTKTGAAFWAELIVACGNAYTAYARGTQFWAMNSKTYALLKSKVVTFTATGEVAASIYGTLPVINGDIVILEFMPDGDIVGGYGDLYLWAQRGGMSIEASTEAQFIQDNTVFRGKERADGTPVIPEGFVAININGNEITTAMTFAADNANNVLLDDLVVGTGALSPAFDSAVTSYTATSTAAKVAVKATAANKNAVVGIEANGKNVANGGDVPLTTGENKIAVTVENGNAVKVYTVVVTKS